MLVIFIFIILIITAADGRGREDHIIKWGPGARTREVGYAGSFREGDTVLFKYKPGEHNLIEVETGYEFVQCIAPPNAKVYTSGEDLITLDAPGIRFFICGIGNHCKDQDVKLRIPIVNKSGELPPQPPSKIYPDDHGNRNKKLLESPPPTHSEFVVGDDQGWNENVDYEAWAKGKEFYMGDILAFNYTQGKHNVIRVDEAAYNECAVPAAGEQTEALATGNDQITLAWMGNIGFISGIGKDCENGLKLLIKVKCPHTRPKPPASLQGGRKLIPSN